MRLDAYLANSGAISSRNKAQTLIEEGKVFVNGNKILKASYQLPQGAKIEIKDGLKYVSRGGLKLEEALAKFNIDVRGLRCIDIGASTGGFTDCLIKSGAAEVYAIDSGHGQLSSELLNLGNVKSYEGFNARNLTEENFGKFDLCVMDVSFISQSLLYENVKSVLDDDGFYISLIKPQFEAGKEFIGKNGLVKDLNVHSSVIKKLSFKAALCGLSMIKLCRSPIQGGDGNTEYLALFTHTENNKNGRFPDTDGVVYGK